MQQQQHALHKYIGVPGTSALFSGLSLSSDSAEHFLPHSLPTSPVVPQTFGEFALVGPPKYAQPPSTAATATLELSGLSGFSHPACPQDTTLLASQLSSGASPQRLGSSGGMMPVPPQTVDLTAKLDELQEEDVEEVSTAFGDFQLGVAPQIKRQSSAPTLIQPMWGGSHPSSTDQTLLSPGHVPTSVSFFQALSEETEPPEDGLRPQEAWSEHRVGSHPHPHQEKEDNYMVRHSNFTFFKFTAYCVHAFCLLIVLCCKSCSLCFSCSSTTPFRVLCLPSILASLNPHLPCT